MTQVNQTPSSIFNDRESIPEDGIHLAISEITAEILSSPELKFLKSLTLKHPELRWLTGGIDATPENSVESDEKSKTIGEKIFPNIDKADLTEYNRTAVGILCLYWVYQGTDEAYEKFTDCQKNSSFRLTRENFTQLHEYTKSILPKQEDFDAMVIYTIINDLGKIHAIIDQIKIDSGNEFALKNINHEVSVDAITSYAVTKSMKKIAAIAKLILDEIAEANVDHDKVLVEGLSHNPSMSPGFMELAKSDRVKILTGLAGEFNMGQYLQGENLPGSLNKLKGMDEASFNFYMAHFVFDLAGAAGQSVQNGSIILDDPTFEGFLEGNKILRDYTLSEDMTEVEAYRAFLTFKMNKFWRKIDTPQEYAIARLACMLRVKTIEELALLEETFESRLGNNSQAILKKELGKNGVDDGFGTLFYYAPGLIGNLQKSISTEEGLELGLTTIARIAQEARIYLKKRQGSGVFTLMMKEIAEIAANDPKLLRDMTFEIVGKGEDGVVVPHLKKPINLDFTAGKNSISHLETELPGKRVALGGIGGGSDAVQAVQVANILKENNKEIPFVFSVRTKTTGSQGPDGKSGEDRVPENAQEVLPGIYEITPDTIMKGRAMEPLIAQDITTYLILIDGEENLGERMDSLVKLVGGVDTVIGVDTGGDALYSTGKGLDQAKSTPDQDLIVLDALQDIASVHNVLTCEIAVGVDSPDDAGKILEEAEAVMYTLSDSDIERVTDYYKSIGMDGTSDVYFGKTPLSWLAALSGKTGVTEIPLPEKVVTDDNNPWNPYIPIQEITKHMFFMRATNHKRAIAPDDSKNSLF